MSKIDVILDLANKNLGIVPDYVLSLSNIRMLYLEGNSIKELPDDLFFKLKKLVWLDLRNNKLKTLPKSIANHPTLETILIQDNCFEELPLEIGLVPNLKVLQIGNNPLTFPSKDVLENGFKSIVTTLKKVYEKNQMIATDVKNKDEVVIVEDVIIDNKEKIKPVTEDSVSMPIISIKSYHKHLKKKKRSKSMKIKLMASYSRISVSKDAPLCRRKSKFTKTDKKYECKVDEQYLKELWLNKLKEVMTKQEELIQREKSLEALRCWRDQSSCNNISSTKKAKDYNFKMEVPYDFDPDYDSMSSRMNLQTQMAKNPRPCHPYRNKTINVEKLISDIVESLKVMEKQRMTDRSPRTQMDQAGREIKKILDLQRRLSALKLRNERME